jgi:hypothetical protein
MISPHLRSTKLKALAASLGLAILTPAIADAPGETQATGNLCPKSYPTAVVADYVLGCMLANGVTPEILQKCSCSVDFIAASVPYDEYVQVETLMRLQQAEGAGRNAVYKDSTWSKAVIAHFRDVQAESTLRCF